MKAPRKGTAAVAERMARAEENFIEVLMNAGGITRSEAVRVYDHYRVCGVLKRDVVGGVISVKHGAFLDREVILRAFDEARNA